MLRHNGEPLELLERWFVVRMDAMTIDHQERPRRGRNQNPPRKSAG